MSDIISNQIFNSLEELEFAIKKARSEGKKLRFKFLRFEEFCNKDDGLCNKDDVQCSKD
jgi:hypothetical protein